MICLIIGIVWLIGMIILTWFNRKKESVADALEVLKLYMIGFFWIFMFIIPAFLILNYFMTH